MPISSTKPATEKKFLKVRRIPSPDGWVDEILIDLTAMNGDSLVDAIEDEKFRQRLDGA